MPDTCTPTQLHHLFVYGIAVTFLVIALFAMLVAGWRTFRLGYALWRESGYDYGNAWAEVHMVGARNRAFDRRIQARLKRAQLHNDGSEK
jgi:hypothetical protein